MAQKKALGKAPPRKGSKASSSNPPTKPVRPRGANKTKTPATAGAKPFFIVAMGASAGGLEAFNQLFPTLPPDTGMAFIIVVHLDPKHESLLPEIISRLTPMPVSQVKDGMPVQPNRVYIIPPNTNMAISKGILKLVPRPVARGPHLAIDYLFRSLAEDQKTNAVGLLFSGTSSDGALGIEAIKHAGGITFAQDESARYDWMPKSAIATGCVDFVLAPEKIAGELAWISKHPYLAPKGPAKAAEPEEFLPEGEEILQKILFQLKKASGVDFSFYKRSTLRRRILRRMVLSKLDNLESYLKFLQEKPGELEALYQDVLIKVTGFFRDPVAYEAMKKEVFPEILRTKTPNSPVRIWVPGCSTGEEAYSLAICWLEFLGDQAASIPIQIFATDVSEPVIEKARNGVYLENIAADVSPERLRRFFVRANGGYQINKTVREMCVFARQNLIQDPPFSKLDLVSCRNLLIYLESVLQKRIVSVFHFALNPGGFLLLGVSETISAYGDMFILLDKKFKVYRKKSGVPRGGMDYLPARGHLLEGGGVHGRPVKAREEPWTKVDLFREADRQVLHRFAPAGVLINENLEILQFRGQTGPYLEPASGEASLSLLKMAREGLTVNLRRIVQQAVNKNEEVKAKNLRVTYNGQPRLVNVEVIPLKPGPGQERFFLVLFEEATAPLTKPQPVVEKVKISGKTPGSKDQVIQELRQELAANKQYLQEVIEDQEGTNDELRALNEEIQSSNEEFQSVNEELETAKEELQSANEELTTLNDELQVRNAELTQLNNDLSNFISSANIPMVVLGRDLRIRLFTPKAQEALNLIPADVGRPLSDIKIGLSLPHLEKEALEVIDTLKVNSAEVQDREGRWHFLQIRPYRTQEDKIEGAVITLLDIHDLKQSLTRTKEAHDFAQAIIQTMRESLLVLDGDLRVKMANQAFYRTFQMTPGKVEGRMFCELGNRQWDIPDFRKLLQEILERDTSLENYRLDFDFPGLGPRTLIFNARCLGRDVAGEALLLLTIEDVTERQQAEDALKESETRLRVLSSSLLSTQEKDRYRLSWELREEIAQYLGALKIQLHAISQKMAQDTEEKISCEDALLSIREIMQNLRQLSLDLSPAILKDLGLSAALKNLVNEFSRYFKIPCTANIDELSHHLVSQEKQIMLYRIIEEALRNIGAHAQATQASVSVKRAKGRVKCQVQDNGKGFDLKWYRSLEPAKRGVGLATMEERAALMGGSVNIWSLESKGTRVSCSIPWEEGEVKG